MMQQNKKPMKAQPVGQPKPINPGQPQVAPPLQAPKAVRVGEGQYKVGNKVISGMASPEQAMKRAMRTPNRAPMQPPSQMMPMQPREPMPMPQIPGQPIQGGGGYGLGGPGGMPQQSGQPQYHDMMYRFPQGQQPNWQDIMARLSLFAGK